MTGVVQKPTAPRPEFDDEASAGGDDAFDDSYDAALEDEFEPEAEDWSESATKGSLAEQLERTTERLRAFGGPRRVDLDQLLADVRTTSNAAVTPTVQQTEPSALPASSGEALSRKLAEDALDDFARAQSLTAVIHGQSGTLAMLGDRLVRVGDELTTGVTVVEIEPRRVRIEGGGNSRWLQLAPFRTRAAATDERGESADAPTNTPNPVPELRYLSPTDVRTAPVTTQPQLEESAPTAEQDEDR